MEGFCYPTAGKPGSQESDPVRTEDGLVEGLRWGTFARSLRGIVGMR